MTATETTLVIFRKWKEDGSIIALFPGLNDETGYANRGMCMSYMHIGQHGEADYEHVIRMTVPAEDTEYEDLYEELLGLGYDLKVVKKKPINI